jgi:hypothetical protein
MRPIALLPLVAGAVLSACQSPTEPWKPALALASVANAPPPITRTDLGTFGPGPGFCLFPSSAALDVN